MENLSGYKGQSFIDSGYIYAPYIPICQTPVVLDPNVFIPKAGILSRYGKKLIEEGKKYYGNMILNPITGELDHDEVEEIKKPKYRSITDPWEISAEAE